MVILSCRDAGKTRRAGKNRRLVLTSLYGGICPNVKKFPPFSRCTSRAIPHQIVLFPPRDAAIESAGLHLLFPFPQERPPKTRNFRQSTSVCCPMIPPMQGLDLFGWLLVASGGLIMALVLLKSFGDSADAVASVAVVERRALEEKRRADNAAAEAAGRAASLEPLALNPDGTIEEPILGIVEQQ
jgi:hypothetical protein